jgi:hypothetical protein
MIIEIKLYQQNKSIYKIAEIVGLSPAGVWKRLKKYKVKMRPPNTRKGNHWAIEKRGKIFLGKDGRYWVRGIQSSKKRNSIRRAVWIMEKKIGRKIPKTHLVHHKNNNTKDDRICNLVLLPKKLHIPNFHERIRK